MIKNESSNNIPEPVNKIINLLKNDRFINYTYERYGEETGDAIKKERDNCLNRLYSDIEKGAIYRK